MPVETASRCIDSFRAYVGMAAGQYALTEPDRQGLYAIIVEGDVVAEQFLLFLQGCPVRAVHSNSVDHLERSFDELFKDGDLWAQMYRMLTARYLSLGA